MMYSGGVYERVQLALIVWDGVLCGIPGFRADVRIASAPLLREKGNSVKYAQTPRCRHQGGIPCALQ